ncbi:MAG: hypothetical protein GX564_01555 [Oligosphaeraceae bacterium]|nr:hypothetical protein [Oligosphaeraceae bacterium]
MNIADRDSSDWFNPVLIKELRQFFHNRIVLSLMALLLVGQLLVLLMVRLEHISSGELPDDLGSAVFTSIIVVLQFCLFLICGVGIAQSFLQERLNSELDFCKLTALSPARIIRGKLGSALVLLLFIHALCLPFVVIAYFLRGIAILQMLQVVVLLLPMTLALVFSSVLVGAIGKKGVIYFLAFGGIYYISMLVMVLNDNRFWSQGMDMAEWLMVVVIPLFWSGLCYVLSVAAISHPMANRMFPARIYLLAMLVLSPAAVAGLAALIDEHVLDSLKIGFSITAAWVVVILALLAACERSRPSLHLQSKCPRHVLLRGGFFLLSSGSGGGILLAALLLLSLLGCPLALSSSNTDWYEILWNFTNIAIYMLCYAALAVFLHELMPRFSGLAWLSLILVVMLLLPAVISAFTSTLAAPRLDYLTITSPFYSPGNTGIYSASALSALVAYSHSLPFAAAALLLASPAIFRQWQALAPKSTAAENPSSLP